MLSLKKFNNSYTVAPFDWKRVAKYLFILAICCIVISLSSVFASYWIIDILSRIFEISEIGKFILLAILSVGLYYLGFRIKSKYQYKVFSSEAIFFLGVISTA